LLSDFYVVGIGCSEKAAAASVLSTDEPSYMEPSRPTRQTHAVQPKPATSMHPQQSYLEDLPPVDSFG